MRVLIAHAQLERMHTVNADLQPQAYDVDLPFVN